MTAVVLLCATQEDQSLLQQLEATAEEALGGRNWMARLDPDFLDNLGVYALPFLPCSPLALYLYFSGEAAQMKRSSLGLHAAVAAVTQPVLPCCPAADAGNHHSAHAQLPAGLLRYGSHQNCAVVPDQAATASTGRQACVTCCAWCATSTTTSASCPTPCAPN
jgi:hypothetical protein